MVEKDRKVPSGSKLLHIFSRQLLDALRDSDAVVVQDASGAVVSTAPDSPATERWIAKGAFAESQRVTRCQDEDGGDRDCYEIPLRTSSESQLVGRLLVRFTSDNPERHSADVNKASAVIKCIARHLAITTDLSSTIVVTAQNKADMGFLAALDERGVGQQTGPALSGILSDAAHHLGCTMAAILAPQAQAKFFWPQDVLKKDESNSAVIRVVGKLYASSRDSRKVIVSSDPTLANQLKTSQGNGQQILCSPIADPQSHVNGVLILVRETQFSRDDVRLARALCVKIGGYLETNDHAIVAPMHRQTVIDRIDSDIERHRQTQRAFLFVDIDRLHIVNDRFGHAIGDDVITSVTEVLSEVAGSRDQVALLSGDLLGLYLDTAKKDQAIGVAKTILDAVTKAPIVEAYKSMDLSVSIGIALIPEHAETGSQAVNVAEVACQSAKSRGTGQHVLFQDHDASIVQRHADLSEIGHLQSALIEDRFVIYAQKIKSLRSSESARKFELLIRMLDTAGNLVPPQSFMSAAERYQMMPALDRWVISHALRQLSEAENMLEINLSSFAINVSGQSITDEGFSEFVVRSVLGSGLSPDSICFEITESSAVKSIDQAVEFINAVRKTGCSVALDDFGTGYCSFAYLQDIPVDFLKIDGMFVKNIIDNPLSEAIVRAVVGIAKVMGAATIAEYVEDADILSRLKRLDVDFGQGFGIGRPEPLAAVLARMESPLDLGLTGTNRIPDSHVMRTLA